LHPQKNGGFTLKEEILKTSTDLFLSLGFKSVTMDDISSHLGMSKKTLYSYYKNKEALVLDVTLGIYNNICCGVVKICQTSNNPIEELYDIKKMVMKSLKGDNSSPIYQLQRYYPKVHNKVKVMQIEYMQERVNDNLERGIEKGLYIPTINKAFVSRIYFIGIQGIKDLNVFPPSDFPIQQLHDQYLDYHLRGIVTPTGRQILNKITNSNHN